MFFANNPSRVTYLAALASVGLITVCQRVPAAHAIDISDLDELKHLRDSWDVQRSDVSSAVVSFRVVSLGRKHFIQSIDATALDSLLANEELVTNNDALKEMIKRLKGKPVRNEPWRTCTLITQGDSTRYEAAGSGTDREIHVLKDGQHFYFDGRTAQVDIHDVGVSRRHVASLAEFRVNPATAGDSIRLVGKSENELEIDCRGVRVTAERSTGAITRVRWSTSTGRLRRAVFQRRWVDFPGGVSFPTLVADVDFDSSGSVSLLKMMVVDDAQFNQPVSEDTFTISTPIQSYVRDYRDPIKPPKPIRVGESKPQQQQQFQQQPVDENGNIIQQ